MSEKEPQYEVLWPLAARAVKNQQGAPAIPDLSGKTVCELWDCIFRGEIIYPEIRKHLSARYPGIRFVKYDVFGNIYGPKQREIVAGLADRLKELKCDAVISGIGA